MITRQFAKLVGARYQTSVSVKNVTGESSSISGGIFSSGSNYMYPKLGGGDSPETYDDYTIEASVSMSTVSSDWRCGRQIDDGTLYYVTGSFRNATAESIIIKEVAMYYHDQNGKEYCLARKVLTTPVTVAPDDVYSVVYRVKLRTS